MMSNKHNNAPENPFLYHGEPGKVRIDPPLDKRSEGAIFEEILKLMDRISEHVQDVDGYNGELARKLVGLNFQEPDSKVKGPTVDGFLYYVRDRLEMLHDHVARINMDMAVLNERVK
jgi:hypothetical protein